MKTRPLKNRLDRFNNQNKNDATTFCERNQMKIYVGNLPYDATENDIEQAFSEFGKVTSVNLLKDNQTGQLKGFGFVEMAEVSEGQAAIKEMSGKDFMGRELKVDQAKERTVRPRGRGDFGSRGRRPGGNSGGNRSGKRNGGGRNRY